MQYGPNNGFGYQHWNGNSYYPPRPPGHIPPGHVPPYPYPQSSTEWQPQHSIKPVQNVGQSYPRQYSPLSTFDPQPRNTPYDNASLPTNQRFTITVDSLSEEQDGNTEKNEWNSHSDNHQGTYYPYNAWTSNWNQQPPTHNCDEPSWTSHLEGRNYEVYNLPSRGRQEDRHNTDVDYRKQEISIPEYRPISSPVPPPKQEQSPSTNRFVLPANEDEDLRIRQGPPRCRSRSPIRQHSFPPSQYTSLDYGHEPSIPSSSFCSSVNRPLFPSLHQDRSAVQRPILAAAASQRISSENLLAVPGRRIRPPKILIILRGLPGAGKSTVARLIKEKETQAALADKQQPACRLISIDDFYMTEDDTATSSGSPDKYVYDADMEEVYKRQLVKLVSRQMDNDFFNFLIVDSVNQRVSELDELAAQARTRGFQVYIVEVTANLNTCITRSTGRRSREDIIQLHRNWEPTSSRFTVIDANSLQQEASVEEVEMDFDVELEEDEKKNAASVKASPQLSAPVKDKCEEDDDEGTERSFWALVKSKWDKEDNLHRLERLDGLKRRLPHSTSSDILSMTDYLQAEASKFRERKAGVKRVTWADLEALRSNSHRRDLGFVIGQTDWSHLTGENDEKTASEALVRTKYF